MARVPGEATPRAVQAANALKGMSLGELSYVSERLAQEWRAVQHDRNRVAAQAINVGDTVSFKGKYGRPMEGIVEAINITTLTVAVKEQVYPSYGMGDKIPSKPAEPTTQTVRWRVHPASCKVVRKAGEPGPEAAVGKASARRKAGKEAAVDALLAGASHPVEFNDAAAGEGDFA